MRVRSMVLAVLAGACVAGGGTVPLSAAPLRAAQSVSLVLDWYPNSDHAGIYVAMRNGYFARRGLDVKPYVPSDSTAQLRLVGAGRADFGVSYETDLLAARAQGVPVRSVMCIMQHPLDTVMTLRSSGITRPRQLAGHTVGMAGASSDQPIVSAMMRHDGSSISRAHMVNVGYNLLPVLLARRVNAIVGVYWTWEALIARERGYAVNVMRVEKWGVPNYCELVLVASDQTIRQRPRLVRNMVQALQQGYADAESHPAVSYAALSGASHPLSRERTLLEGSVRLLRPIVTGARTIGYQDASQWTRYAAWLRENRLLPAPVNVSQAFTNAFLAPKVR